MSDRPEDTGVPGAEPPMAAPPPPPVAPDTVALDAGTPVHSGGLTGLGGRVAAGALGLVLLVGGLVFAATQTGSDGGAQDPQAAVEEMFAAIADEDVLGLLATLEPRERDALAGPVEDLFGELERLEVLDESFELSGVAGLDLEFADLTFRQERVRRDLVRVHLTGGTASFAVDTDEIPVGDFLTDTFERFGVEYQGIQRSESDQLDPAATGDTFVVVRDTGDGWRVSLGYTAVEVARLRNGTQVPVAGAGLAAIGADTPEEAVEGFLQAAADIDIEGVVARLSPGELGALHDYWPALVGDADLPTREDVDAEVELTDLVLRSTTDGDRGRVFVDSIGVDVTTEDFTGGGTVVDGCIEIRGDVRTSLEDEGFEIPEGPICQEDIEEILEEATGESGLGRGGIGIGGLGGLAGFTPGDGEVPDLGITVVRIDGSWFVAPFGTFADVGLSLLETVDREDLDAMVDAVEEFFGAGFFTEDAVGGGFVPPGMGEDLGNGFSIGEGGTERFSDVGEPIGGVDLAEPDVASIDTIVGEMLTVITNDPAVATCTLEQLRVTATTEQMYELADAYLYEFEPSPETQDLLFTALTACGG